MTQDINRLIGDIYSKDFSQASKRFNSILMGRVNERLNDEKVRLANTMFQKAGADEDV
jgi:hypothetical protein